MNKCHTTLTIDPKLLDSAKKAKINCSEALEEALRVRLGLENDLSKLTQKEAKLRQELDLLNKQKEKLVVAVSEKQVSSTFEADKGILLRAWKRKLCGEEAYFLRIFNLFMEKWGFERAPVMDFLTGRRKDLVQSKVEEGASQ